MKPDPDQLISTERATLPTGQDVVATLYRTIRAGGRRIILTDLAGAILHDTDDCYGMSNAMASVDAWIAQHDLKEATRMDRDDMLTPKDPPDPRLEADRAV